jgi:hypothetical protein
MTHPDGRPKTWTLLVKPRLIGRATHERGRGQAMTADKTKERTIEVIIAELVEMVGRLQELLPAYLEERTGERGGAG